jgi:mRNA interferase RelE/StbE
LDWTIKLDTHAIKQLKKLDKLAQRRIAVFLQKRLACCETPRNLGKPLVGRLSGLWRYRIGDYRIISKIKDREITVLVINIGHRKEIYRLHLVH